MIHELGSIPSSKQKSTLRKYTKWKDFIETGWNKEVIREIKDCFRQGYLPSADLEIPDIPFLGEVETAINSWFDVLEACGSTLGLFLYSSLSLSLPFFCLDSG